MFKPNFMKKLLLFLTVFSATLVSAQNLPSYVPTNGLIGWWPFNGNANDESGNSNNGTVYGATLTSDRDGILDAAYSFDGSNDYINLGQLSILSNSPDSYTQLAWLKFDDFSDSRIIGTKRNSSGGWATPYANDTALMFYADDAGYTGANIGYTTSIDTGNYYFLCFVKDTSYYSIYINGALVDTMFDSHSINSTSSDYYIGHHSGWNKYMKGTIDCFGLWNRALNSNEIMQFYNGCQDSIQYEPVSGSFQTVPGTANFTTSHSDSTATYQWQENNGTGWTNLSDFGIYSGTTTDSLVLTGITTTLNGYGYRCIIDACTMDTSDVAFLTVVDNVGIEESAAALTISPNPTSGLIHVNVKANYSVYSMTGQKVAEGKTEGQIDISNLPAGSYNLLLITEESTTTHTIQKI